MAVKELQGPAQGDEEEVSERIRDRYLVGILALVSGLRTCPCRCSRSPPPRPPRTTMFSKATSRPVRNFEIEGVGRGDVSGDDGPTELSAPMSKAVYPSSLGLSFCVPLEPTSLKVTTRWGHYDKAPSEFLTNPKTGTPSGSGSADPAAASPTRFRSRRVRSDPSSPTSRSPTPRSRDSFAVVLTTGASPSSWSTMASSRRPRTGADLDVPVRDGGRGT